MPALARTDTQTSRYSRWTYAVVDCPVAWDDPDSAPLRDIKRAILAYRDEHKFVPVHLTIPAPLAFALAGHRDLEELQRLYPGLPTTPGPAGVLPRQILGLLPHVTDDPGLDRPCVSYTPFPGQGALSMVLSAIPPGCACGGTITLTEDRVRDEYCVTHTGPQGTATLTVAAHQLARIAPADIPAVVQDIADQLCRGSARPPATGGVVAPGQQYLVGEPSPEMYTLPGDATPRYNRDGLRAQAATAVPDRHRIFWQDCPCGGIVAWQRVATLQADHYDHLDTAGELRRGDIADEVHVAAGHTAGAPYCPARFADRTFGPGTTPRASSRAPASAFACAIEYPDGARAATVVAAADRARVEAALIAAGVRFTLTPEGA